MNTRNKQNYNTNPLITIDLIMFKIVFKFLSDLNWNLILQFKRRSYYFILKTILGLITAIDVLIT